MPSRFCWFDHQYSMMQAVPIRVNNMRDVNRVRRLIAGRGFVCPKHLVAGTCLAYSIQGWWGTPASLLGCCMAYAIQTIIKCLIRSEAQKAAFDTA
jgi:hypothetical protein